MSSHVRYPKGWVTYEKPKDFDTAPGFRYTPSAYYPCSIAPPREKKKKKGIVAAFRGAFKRMQS